jgi:tungstate transport system substrate-binding protein
MSLHRRGVDDLDAGFGLFDYLLPLFTRKMGIEVRVCQGQAKQSTSPRRAMRTCCSCTTKVGEVRRRWRREALRGHVQRFHHRGAAGDPVGVKGMSDASAALAKIAAAAAPFASRGDDSGTHKAELRLWKEAGVDVKAASGTWYRETGSGMGPTLNAAAGMGAYALADRGTWLAFKNKGDLQILVEGDKRLFNQYGIMLVNPVKFPHVKAADGQAFLDWVISPEGQQAIANYKIEGQQLFFPNHQPTS